MAEYGRGAKAGAIAGIVLGIIEAIGLYGTLSYTSNQIRTTLPAGVTLDQAVATLTISTFIGSIIGGAILGIIFAAVQNKYMTSKSLPMRGIVFGIIYWLIGIILNIGNLGYGTTYIALTVIIGLVASLIYGYLLGHFFARFGPKQPAQPGQPTTM